jgi:hypothetical protein
MRGKKGRLNGIREGKGDVADLCARRARTIRMCSLDARNGGRPRRPFHLSIKREWGKVDKEGYVNRYSLTVKRFAETFLRLTNNDSRITVTS